MARSILYINPSTGKPVYADEVVREEEAAARTRKARAKRVVARRREVAATGTPTTPLLPPPPTARPKSPRRAQAHDPVLAALDESIAAARRNVAKTQRLSPRQVKLRRDLRAAYANNMGDNLHLGHRLGGVAAGADPLINFTEKVTRPFTTPASVAASLIDADPTNALKQLVSATYWGGQRLPSQSLHDRGWLPGGAAGLLLGLGADVAPSFAIPGFKGAGRAAGVEAARTVARDQRLVRNTTPRVPVGQQEARLPGKPAPRQQRAVRLQPHRGPDIIINPHAQVVPLRSAPGGGAARGGRPRTARPTRRPRADVLPYADRRVQRALDEFRDATLNHQRVTAQRPTRLQAARAGQRSARAEAALRAAENDALRRIKATPVRPTGAQRAQVEARLPGGAVSAGVRPLTLVGGRRGPDLPPRAARVRTRMQPPVRPADVPYSKVHDAEIVVAEAARAAKAMVSSSKGPSVESAIRAGELLGRAKAAVKTMPRSNGFGMGAGHAATYTRLVNAIGRVVALRGTAGVRPSPQALIAAGRELEAAVSAHRRVARDIRAATIEGRRRVRGLQPPVLTAPPRQLRAAQPASGVSVFDNRPHTLTALRGATSVPLEGARLPDLRVRVDQARGEMKTLVQRRPTEKQIGRAGQRLAKAEAKLRKAEKALKTKRRPTTRMEATGRQTSIHRQTFTGSREREWIDANMEYEAAFHDAVRTAPIGVNVTLPFRFDKKGITIPFTTVAAANKFRAATANSPLGEAILAYRQWVVSRYGPNEVVRQGAIAADDIVRHRSGQSARFIRDETRKAKLTEDELILASHWLEGTATRGVPAHVRDYALKMAEFTERNLDEFLQAGGKVKRFGRKLEGGLDRQYVLHLLPKGEWDDFAVSTLARRQVLYGRRPSFTQHREVLTIDALKKAGFHPVERLDELTFARAMAHHRALAEMELTRGVAHRFGRKADEAPDDWQAIPSQFTDADVVVPKDVAQTLRNVIAARMALPANKLAARLQHANQRWKEWALLTAGHDIRNQIGDSALTFQRTMSPVAPLLSLTFGAKTMRGRGMVGGRSRMTSAEARRLAETSGMHDTGLLGGDVLADVTSVEAQGRGVVRGTRVVNPLKMMHRGVRSARTGREGVNKMGVFTRELRRGEGAVHAARVAKDTLFDYADVGKAVNWARRSPVGAPFATWTAKNLPAQIRMAFERPGQLSAALTALESLRRQTGGWPRFLMPDWFRSRVPIPIPGYGNTNVELPVNTLNLIPTGSLGGGGSFTATIREWQSQLGPLMQLPIAATGNDPLTGEKFRGQKPASRMEQFLQQFPVTAFFLGGADMTMSRDEQGNRVAVPAARDDLLSWVFRTLTPGLTNAGRLTGSEGRDTFDSIRGPVLGHTARPFFNRAKVEALQRQLAYEYRDKVGEFNRRLRANAPGWHKGDPIPPQLRPDYRDIMRIVAQGEWIQEALRQLR